MCVNPLWVPEAATVLGHGGPAVASVCGFPSGAIPSAIKAAEARLAELQGALEIDMVFALGHFKAGHHQAVKDDVAAVRQALSNAHTLLKVIIEAPLLTRDEIMRASELVCEAGADFVKTGTGQAGPVTADQVKVIRQAVGPGVRIKAAGGIRTRGGALLLLQAGANRLGTSHAAALLADGETNSD